LIVGIILTTLTRQNKQNLRRYVIAGAVSGILLSIVGGTVLFLSAQGLEEETMELFEGTMMLVASGLIAYFVIWMAQQNQNISASITNNVTKTSTGFGLAGLAFLGVFREGLELVIFTMANLSAQATDIALGTVSGIALAIMVGVLIFKSTVKLNLGWIFKGLGLVLIYLGAELLEEGLIKLVPSVSSFENVIFYAYILIALVIFFRSDLNRLLRKAN
jgi:high-affinity iron transporter